MTESENTQANRFANGKTMGTLFSLSLMNLQLISMLNDFFRKSCPQSGLRVNLFASCSSRLLLFSPSLLQVLVEKLLRSCPGIKRIFVLLRPKKGLDARQRLDELFNSQVSPPLALLASCR